MASRSEKWTTWAGRHRNLRLPAFLVTGPGFPTAARSPARRRNLSSADFRRNGRKSHDSTAHGSQRPRNTPQRSQALAQSTARTRPQGTRATPPLTSRRAAPTRVARYPSHCCSPLPAISRKSRNCCSTSAVVAREEKNLILNPLHPRFHELRMSSKQRVTLDKRLFSVPAQTEAAQIHGCEQIIPIEFPSIRVMARRRCSAHDLALQSPLIGANRHGTLPPANHYSLRTSQVPPPIFKINGGRTEEVVMGRGILLWLLGVPIPIILLLAMCSHH